MSVMSRRAYVHVLATLVFACGENSDKSGESTRTSEVAIDASAAMTTLDGSSSDAHTSQNDAGLGKDAAVERNDGASGHVYPDLVQYFPPDSFMYRPVDGLPVDPESPSLISWLDSASVFGPDGMAVLFTVAVYDAQTPVVRVPIQQKTDFWAPDCDPAPVPLPEHVDSRCAAPSSCTVVIVDSSSHRLYELGAAAWTGPAFMTGCAAIWDQRTTYGDEGRGEQCTSANSAGLPIAPLSLAPNEVAAGSVAHALNLHIPNTMLRPGVYKHPATHAGLNSGPALAPVTGMHLRLRADYDLESLPGDGARTVARALQTYGVILSEGGGAYLTAQDDMQGGAVWGGVLQGNDLKQLRISDFEIVATSAPVALTYECVRQPITD
ncbi:MAG: hypothetical protein JWN04_507 [Myxococcaceae bacterium]|nr:hypothetical protein [Myxococcaceae bacterium]